MGTDSYIPDSPTWDELDAIAKGKSVIDLAEEIWRLRTCAQRMREAALLDDWHEFDAAYDAAMSSRNATKDGKP